MEERGLKEVMELIDGLELLMVCLKEVKADGKVGVDDLQVAMKLVAQSQKLVDAAQGMKDAGKELADVDKDEAVAIVERLYAAVAKVNAAGK